MPTLRVIDGRLYSVKDRVSTRSPALPAPTPGEIANAGGLIPVRRTDTYCHNIFTDADRTQITKIQGYGELSSCHSLVKIPGGFILCLNTGRYLLCATNKKGNISCQTWSSLGCKLTSQNKVRVKNGKLTLC